MLHHVLMQIISDLVSAPHGATEEMLRGIRGLFPGIFSELTAILSLHGAYQPAKRLQRPPAQFGSLEPVADQGGNFSDFLSPVTRLLEGKRLLFLFSIHHDLHLI